METWKLYALVTFVGYFLGAIPFGYLIGKARGINLLEEGSGSTGATNVRRLLGKKASYIVFALDALKGYLAAAWAHLLANNSFQFQHLAIIGILAAILGHSYSIFLRFRGGKGIAVTIGGFAALMPNVLFVGLITWAVFFYATRFVSLASLCFGAILPLCSYLFGYSFYVNIFTCLIAVFIFIRHIPNIRRLLMGTEYRFGQKPNNSAKRTTEK